MDAARSWKSKPEPAARSRTVLDTIGHARFLFRRDACRDVQAIPAISSR